MDEKLGVSGAHLSCAWARAPSSLELVCSGVSSLDSVPTTVSRQIDYGDVP